MATERPPTHEHLLTLANKVKAAVEDGDVARLRSAAWRLYDGLMEHLSGEAPALMRTSPAESRLLRRGQRRIVDTASALVRTMELPVREANCESLAELLAAELSLQAEDERRCLSVAGDEVRCGRVRTSEHLEGMGRAV